MRNSPTIAQNLFRAPVLRAAPLAAFSALPAGYSIVPVPVRKRRTTYLDTHDWRLYQAGLLLEWTHGTGHSVLTLRELDGDESLESQGVSAVPCPAAKVPPGAVRAAIATLIESRALLPTASRQGECAVLDVRDAEDKLVLRVGLELTPDTAPSPKRQSGAVSTARIELWPLRGYETAAAHVRSALLDHGALPERCDLAHSIWGDAPRAPWTLPALPGSGVVAADQASVALRKVLRVLVAVIEDCEAGVLNGTDIEFLHDYRVAIRRIRSTLRDLPTVLDPALAKRLSQALGNLGRLGGEVRDLDVFLEDMSAITQGLAPQDRRLLRKHFERERQRLHQSLRRLIKSAAHRQSMSTLHRIIAEPATDDLGPDAARRVGPCLYAAFAKLHRRCLRDARRIKVSTPNEQIHDLRKRCKRLRYLLDVFQPLYPGKSRAHMVSALKSIQDDLGIFQDCDAQLVHLEQAAQAIGELPAASDGIGQWQATHDLLAERVRRRQRAHLKRFRVRFRAFDSADRDADLTQLFAGDANTGAETVDKAARDMQALADAARRGKRGRGARSSKTATGAKAARTGRKGRDERGQGKGTRSKGAQSKQAGAASDRGGRHEALDQMSSDSLQPRRRAAS